MSHLRKFHYLIPILLIGISLFNRCTFVKMGSLFLSGDIHQKQFTRTVDFEYSGNLIFVKVKINNIPGEYRVIFDTGAAFSVISNKIAQKIGVKSIAESTIKDAARNKGKVKFCKIPRLTIAGISFINTAAAIMDLKQDPWLRCYQIDGVVGMSLLRLVNNWQIDYQSQKITFSDQKVLIDPSVHRVVIPFYRNIQRIPKINLHIHDQLKIKCTVDLGSTSTFNLDIKTWQKLKKIKPDIKYISGTGELAAGALGKNTGKMFLAVFDNIKAGKTPLGRHSIKFMPNVLTSVGNGFFRNYTITFNWQKKILTLAIPSTHKRKIEFPTYGFGYAYNENTRSLYVNFLYNPSPASQAGLKVKDKIISINGLSLKGIQLEDYCKFLFHPENLMGKGNQIELVTQRNGQTKTVTLTKKDLLANL